MNYSRTGQRLRSEAAQAARLSSQHRPRTHGEAGNAAPRARYGSSWVRSSLSQLDFLCATRSVDAEAQRVVDFAVRWAPFGGASSGDLLVTFGVERTRFLEMVRTGLQLRRADNDEARWLKGRLLDALALAWDDDDILRAGSSRW